MCMQHDHSLREVSRLSVLCIAPSVEAIFTQATAPHVAAFTHTYVLGFSYQAFQARYQDFEGRYQETRDFGTGYREVTRFPPASQGSPLLLYHHTALKHIVSSYTKHVCIPASSNLQDALERAYQQDVSNQTEEAKRSYHFAVKAINEGLALKVPSAWLPGTNVSKLRCNLNDWLQLAVDRYCTLTCSKVSQLHVKCISLSIT